MFYLTRWFGLRNDVMWDVINIGYNRLLGVFMCTAVTHARTSRVKPDEMRHRWWSVTVDCRTTGSSDACRKCRSVFSLDRPRSAASVSLTVIPSTWPAARSAWNGRSTAQTLDVSRNKAATRIATPASSNQTKISLRPIKRSHHRLVADR